MGEIVEAIETIMRLEERIAVGSKQVEAEPGTKQPCSAGELLAKSLKEKENHSTVMLTEEEQRYLDHSTASTSLGLGASSAESTLLSDIRQANIAIVDDEPINIKVVRNQLGEGGYKRFLSTTESENAIAPVPRVTP